MANIHASKKLAYGKYYCHSRVKPVRTNIERMGALMILNDKNQRLVLLLIARLRFCEGGGKVADPGHIVGRKVVQDRDDIVMALSGGE